MTVNGEVETRRGHLSAGDLVEVDAPGTAAAIVGTAFLTNSHCRQLLASS